LKQELNTYIVIIEYLRAGRYEDLYKSLNECDQSLKLLTLLGNIPVYDNTQGMQSDLGYLTNKFHPEF
jgi:hypothetical protein